MVFCPACNYADPDSIRNSDFECNSESIYIDDNSEEILPSSSDEECQPDSAELSSASSKEPCLSCAVNTGPQETLQQAEAKPQATSKRRRLRMMDEDSDGVRVKIIPCPKEQFRQRMAATKVLEDDFMCLTVHSLG